MRLENISTIDSTHSVLYSAPHSDVFSFPHLLEKVKNATQIDTPFGEVEFHNRWIVNIGCVDFDFGLTKHLIFVFISAILLVLIMMYVVRQNTKRKVPHGFGNLIEVFIIFIRDEIVIPNMGKSGLRYLPFILTLFFFILTMNLLGLVPYGGLATSNLAVTGGLALIAFVMIQYSAIRAQGIKHYLMHLTGGIHWTLWPIMIPIEIIGLFTKPFALCMRLFANMTGGKTVFISIIGLIFLFASYWLAPIPVLFGVGIYMLEMFVALLQSYIFAMLTSVFMGLGMQVAHQEEH